MAVAIEGGQVVGFAGHRRLGSINVVTDCFVDPEHHARGIGTKLLRSLLPTGEPVMTMASADPKAHSLYHRFGMEEVTDCPYVVAGPQGDSVLVSEVDSYPVSDEDREHLLSDLGGRFVTVGRNSAATVTDHSIESSLVGPDDDASAVIAALVNHVGGRVEIQMSTEHLAYESLESVETDRDTLMATPGTELPDYTRVTFNGDLLAIQAS
jgi:hypothetical protein